VRQTLRWLIAVAVGAGVFLLTWWSTEEAGVDRSNAVAVAAAVTTLLSTPFFWWASLDNVRSPKTDQSIRKIRATAGAESSSHVFICYSHKDRRYVDQLADHLAQSGVSAWFDTEIPPGYLWNRWISEQIDACAAVVVVMTPHAHESRWVNREIIYAQEADKPILPLLLVPGRKFFSLIDLQYEDVTGARMPGEAFLARLRAVIAPDPTPVAPIILVPPDPVADRPQGGPTIVDQPVVGGYQEFEREILAARDLTPKVRDELGRADNPAQWLLKVAPRLGPMKTSAAARLIAAPAELASDQVHDNLLLTQRLALLFTKTVQGTATNPVSWVSRMLAHLGNQPIPPVVCRAAMYGGLDALIVAGPRRALLDNADFRAVCLAIAMDNDAPAEVRDLFDQWRLVPVPARGSVAWPARHTPRSGRAPVTRRGGRPGLRSLTMLVASAVTLIAIAGWLGLYLVKTPETPPPKAMSGTPVTPIPSPFPSPSPLSVQFLLPMPPNPTEADVESAANGLVTQLNQRLGKDRRPGRVALVGLNARVLSDYLSLHGLLKGLGYPSVTVSPGGTATNVEPGTVVVVVYPA
jgi:hypothetical protein